jgi:adenosylcobinamide kinase / adenosylcobinamide-phosphate guanylyltransferase
MIGPSGHGRSTGVDVRCPPGVTLLLGGARSGKSDLAVQLAVAWGGPVTFVATCSLDADGAGGVDANLAARVGRHRADRPGTWRTVEESVTVHEVVSAAPVDHLVLLDCVTLWVARMVMDAVGEDAAAERADELVAAFQTRQAPVLLVSNEVGLGVHPSSALGSAFRDALGRVNRRLGIAADRSVVLIAGRVVDLTAPSAVFA